jgi:hypothetical protein
VRDNLRRRVAKLEARDPVPCEECGRPPDKTLPVGVEVYWDTGEEGEEKDLGPTHCHACGRTLIHEVTWKEDGE